MGNLLKTFFCLGFRRNFSILVVGLLLAFTACGSDGGGGHAHEWGEYSQTTPPTCVSSGIETRACKICSEIDTETQEGDPVDPDAHDWDWAVDTSPTCGIAGKDTGTCLNAPCTEICTRIVVATGEHSFGVNNYICTECFSIAMVQLNIAGNGKFTMGQSGVANATPHEVTLTNSFYMGKYEVTQELYEAVMGTNPSYFTSGNGRSPDGEEVDEKRPVETVTWYDAVEFCNKLSEREGLVTVYTITGRTPETGYPITAATVTVTLTNNGYRLPTEAEWEYACRAGTTTAYGFGDIAADDTPLGDYAWYLANSGSKTHEVGLKSPNAWGLYDMHGNVLEWCWDWYEAYSANPQTDPEGPSAGAYRVIRGGSWGDSAGGLRSVSRGYGSPGFRFSSDIGFRVVRP